MRFQEEALLLEEALAPPGHVHGGGPCSFKEEIHGGGYCSSGGLVHGGGTGGSGDGDSWRRPCSSRGNVNGGGLAPPEVKFVEVGTRGTLGDGTPRCGLTGSGSPTVT